jgi:hypothetical protein
MVEQLAGEVVPQVIQSGQSVWIAGGIKQMEETAGFFTSINRRLVMATPKTRSTHKETMA